MARSYIHDGRRVSAPANGKHSQVITWEDSGGKRINPDYFNDDDQPQPKRIVLHWGGRSPQILIDILEGKRASSHFGIHKDKIYQLGDTAIEAGHAGHANHESIGIDITQSINPRHQKEHGRQGLIISTRPNPIYELDPRDYYYEVVYDSESDDFYPDVNTLDPQTAQTLRDALLDLTYIHNIPLRVPRNPDGSYRFSQLSKSEVRDFEGILGHFHTSERKWDPLPWWKQIMDPLLSGAPQRQNGGFFDTSSASSASRGGGGGGAGLLLGLGAIVVGGLIVKKKYF